MRLIKINSDSEFKHGFSREEFIDFLYVHLDRFGDEIEAINKCLDFAFGRNNGLGGFALACVDDANQLVGALIMNKTGMSGYIPENILVYVAVHEGARGKGIGKYIIENAIDMVQGDVKLHVEYDNPAKRLYERIGFATKYAEMRFKKDSRR